MPFYMPPSAPGSRFTTILHSYAQDDGLPFTSVLTEEQIQQAAVAEDVRFGNGNNDVYTPAVTLWAFIGQVLAGNQSCVAAVARIIVLFIALRRPLCSAATGAYCKARAKLPETFLRRLTYQVGAELEDQAPAPWRWHDRRVLLADGVEITLADTPENQAAYPQPTTQRPGIGFPMIRLVVLLTFATAALVGASFGPYAGKETGESALLRQLFEQLRSGDVLVADRYYSITSGATISAAADTSAITITSSPGNDLDAPTGWTKPPTPPSPKLSRFANCASPSISRAIAPAP